MKISPAVVAIVSIVGTASPYAFMSASEAESEAAGLLAGAPFRPDNVKLSKNSGLDSVSVGGKKVDVAQGYSLVFSVGKEFIPDNELTLRFVLNRGETPFGRTIQCKPYEFGTAAFRQQHYKSEGEGSVGRGVTAVFVSCAKPASGLASSMHAMDKISATLIFDKRVGNTVSGTIQLRLEDAKKTRLSGAFTAKLEGF